MEVVRLAEILLVVPVVEAFAGSVVLQLPPLPVVDVLAMPPPKIGIVHILLLLLC